MFFELFLGYLLIWYIWDYLKYKGRPPGPFRFPILGTLPQILLAHPIYIHLGLLKMKKKYKEYKNLMFIKLGAKELVVINSYEAAKDLLKLEETNGRDPQEGFIIRSFNKEIGVVQGYGEISNNSRKFFFNTLAEFGYGNRLQTEEFLVKEAVELVKHISKKIQENNGIVKVEGIFNIPSFNIMMTMLTGERREYYDEEFLDFVDATKKYTESVTFIGSLGMMFPLVNYFYDTIAPAKKCIERSQGFIQKLFGSFIANKENIIYPKNFIEKCVVEMENNLKNGSKNYLFSKENLICILHDIFQAGIETTASSFTWIILYLALNQEIQDEIHKEIDKLLTKEDKPTFGHRKSLVLLRASILEGLRIKPIFPLGVVRKAVFDIKYKGITIDKNTGILTNAYAMNNDKEYWGDPEEFRPSRFIDKTTGAIVKDPRIMTFGLGKKNCLGEHLAMDTMFIFLTSILQHFKITPVPNTTLPTLDPLFGLTITAIPFNLLFIKK